MKIAPAPRPPLLDDLERLRDMLVRTAGRMGAHIDDMTTQDAQHADALVAHREAHKAVDAAIAFAAAYDASQAAKDPP